MKQDKSILRKQLLVRRKELSQLQQWQATLASRSDAVLQFIENLSKQYGASIGGYVALNDEFDISALLLNLQKRGFLVSLPYLLDNSKMCFKIYDCTKSDSLEQSNIFKIWQPKASASSIRPSILLVPLVGFDKNGVRLGYGGGFYDRYLAQQLESGIKPYVLGVGFAGQEVSFIEKQPHDYDLDAILTEDGIRLFSKT